MINEDYCSYEVAKLLKEKGFEGDINAYYHIWDNGNKVCSVQEFSHSEAPHLYIPAPTHQMAMKWLRKNGVITEVLHVTSKPVNDGWFYSYQKNNDSETNLIEYPSYEDAVEAALKYCLENLI